MPTLIFDVETVGEDYDEMDPISQHILTRWLEKNSKSDQEYESGLIDIKNGLGFSPLTGSIVVIGVLDAERNKGVVYYQDPGKTQIEFEQEGIVFKQRTEKEMLELFWRGIVKYDDFVSFNGRAFDVPYMMIRSAIHQIRPTRNLLSNRYLGLQRGCRHIDLCDQLSFYGAVGRRPSLHLACRAFGIDSPKSGGVTGDDVTKLFKAGRGVDIAKYNMGDLRSTAKLYRYWQDYLNV
jgi:3'-5' exonuclease